MPRTAIRTDAAPTAHARVLPGGQARQRVQVSGQGPMDPVTKRYIAEGDVHAQTFAPSRTCAPLSKPAVQASPTW